MSVSSIFPQIPNTVRHADPKTLRKNITEQQSHQHNANKGEH
jgi:hypothetical protein